MTKYFNFNNEVDTFAVDEDENGVVTVLGTDGQPMATYDSMQQFAEFYAVARDVRPDNLKNWTLVENGDVVSFVLRAATAGISADAMEGPLGEVLDSLRQEGAFHPLDVERLAQELDGSGNVMNTLALSAVPDVAREAYDRLAAMNAFAEPVEEPEEVEVDNRSEVERYLDTVLWQDKSLSFFAVMLNLDPKAGKDEILAAIGNGTIPFTADMLCDLYEGALSTAKENINVGSRFDALLVVSQAVPGEPDNEAKNRLMVTARIAGRNVVNVASYTVGHSHIQKSAVRLDTAELEGQEIYMVNNAPVIVTFDASVDAELEAEREQQAEDLDEDAEGILWPDEDDDEDDDDDDYDDDDDNEDDGIF